MSSKIFPRLAFSGINKNRKIYIPYILSCIGSVAMYYIVDFLSASSSVKAINEGSNVAMILSIGKFVIAAFAFLFLMYTNSFISRRRNREFGLYNILGMDRKGISRIILWESLSVSAISLVAGLLSGIVFSKLAELLLLYIVKSDVSFSYEIPLSSVKYTVLIFLVIFAVLLIKSLISVRKTNVLELMNSEKAGEKPVKANWVLAVLGLIILGVAYYIAVTTESPLAALLTFLAAVIMVIVATYLLFISGSVALCKLLQKNKKYYYKKNHFVSVSSMAYRMKRNGAGLASICILSIMVLVMIASSASLYFGADDAMKSRFPQENQLTVLPNDINQMTEENYKKLSDCYESVLKNHNVKAQNTVEFTYADITAFQNGNTLDPDVSRHINDLVISDNLRTIYFMPVSDYNRLMNTNLVLNKNETAICAFRCKYDENTFNLGDLHLNVVSRLSEFPEIPSANVNVMASLLMVIPDIETLRPIDGLADFNGDRMLELARYYGFDLDGVSKEETVKIHYEQANALGNIEFVKNHTNDNGYSIRQDCLAEQRDDFYTTFGGLFFIGILLSIVFIFAMAMIIYYKQTAEGYEDRTRFEIMQKVGMTKTDIKKSINSQILTVFFAPLVMAGVHLCFAFPAIWRLLQLFNLENLPFVIMISAIAFAVFSLFYALIYKITARSYYNIVASDFESKN